jgi:hypothetical protein
MTECRNCLLPASAPGADIDASGWCRACRQFDPTAAAGDDAARQRRQEDLENALQTCRGQDCRYDCLVPLSGGKDSLFLLHRLKVDYGLNVLAFTVDVNIPDIAWRNIRRTLDRLQIDHLSYSPPSEFYRKLFRYLLANQEERGAVYTVSYVYAPLFEGDAIRVALEKGIPLVLAGYSPGQPEPERMLYEFSRKLVCEIDWTPPELQSCGEFTPEELGRFFNPSSYPAGTEFPRYLAPFHAWPYSQDEVMRLVVEKELVEKGRYASPVLSNYPINWLLMYSDLRSFGYNPYAPEFSTLIREGKASRRYWQIMGPVVDRMIRHRILLGRHITHHLKWLGLRPDELQITRPFGAYDPVVPE